jgi:crossover junction endodeoxyribonuclease RuvC
MIVLGVDPGVNTTGYGVVAQTSGGAVSLLECGVVRTAANASLAARLRTIFEGVQDVLSRHPADVVAVEGVFYGRNVRSTVILGHARASVLLAAAVRDLEVAEYSPAQIKSAVAGTGRATKEQVQYMVQQHLRLRTAPTPADAADGAAVALCHALRGSLDRRLADAAGA